MSRRFLDSNVIIYALSTGSKQQRAAEILASGGTIAVQTLNEIANIGRRKLRMSWEEVRATRTQILDLCTVWEKFTAGLQSEALDLAERYQLSMYDSTLLIAALESGCDAFLSEDLQDGLVVQGRLVVQNPFISR